MSIRVKHAGPNSKVYNKIDAWRSSVFPAAEMLWEIIVKMSTFIRIAKYTIRKKPEEVQLAQWPKPYFYNSVESQAGPNNKVYNKKPGEMHVTELQKLYEYKNQEGCVGCQKTYSQDPVEYVSMNLSLLWVKHTLWEIFLNSFTFGEICESRTGIFRSNKFPMNFWIYFIWTILQFYY